MEKLANEAMAMFMEPTDQWSDRCLFVENLGKLLAQTRECVEGCRLLEGEIVVVTFKGGYTRQVNVNCDSYAAIIKDVTRRL